MLKNDEIVREHCVSIGEKPSVGIFRVTRSFFLQVRKGPNEPLQVGALCELCQETALGAFSLSRVIPHDPAIPALGVYEVLRPFRVIMEKLWVDLQASEKIKLSADEALPLLRSGKIILLREEDKK